MRARQLNVTVSHTPISRATAAFALSDQALNGPLFLPHPHPHPTLSGTLFVMDSRECLDVAFLGVPDVQEVQEVQEVTDVVDVVDVVDVTDVDDVEVIGGVDDGYAGDVSPPAGDQPQLSHHQNANRKKLLAVLMAVLVILALAIGIGVGVGGASSPSPPAPGSPGVRGTPTSSFPDIDTSTPFLSGADTVVRIDSPPVALSNGVGEFTVRLIYSEGGVDKSVSDGLKVEWMINRVAYTGSEVVVSIDVGKDIGNSLPVYEVTANAAANSWEANKTLSAKLSYFELNENSVFSETHCDIEEVCPDTLINPSNSSSHTMRCVSTKPTYKDVVFLSKKCGFIGSMIRINESWVFLSPEKLETIFKNAYVNTTTPSDPGIPPLKYRDGSILSEDKAGPFSMEGTAEVTAGFEASYGFSMKPGFEHSFRVEWFKLLELRVVASGELQVNLGLSAKVGISAGLDISYRAATIKNLFILTIPVGAAPLLIFVDAFLNLNVNIFGKMELEASAEFAMQGKMRIGFAYDAYGDGGSPDYGYIKELQWLAGPSFQSDFKTTCDLSVTPSIEPGLSFKFFNAKPQVDLAMGIGFPLERQFPAPSTATTCGCPDEEDEGGNYLDTLSAQFQPRISFDLYFASVEKTFTLDKTPLYESCNPSPKGLCGMCGCLHCNCWLCYDETSAPGESGPSGGGGTPSGGHGSSPAISDSICYHAGVQKYRQFSQSECEEQFSGGPGVYFRWGYVSQNCVWSNNNCYYSAERSAESLSEVGYCSLPEMSREDCLKYATTQKDIDACLIGTDSEHCVNEPWCVWSGGSCYANRMYRFDCRLYSESSCGARGCVWVSWLKQCMTHDIEKGGDDDEILKFGYDTGVELY